MPFWISQAKVLLDAEDNVRRASLQILHSFAVCHAVRQCYECVDMFRQNFEVMNFDVMLASGFSYCRSNKIFILKLLHHLVAVLRAPFHVPKVYADFVAVMLQFYFHVLVLRDES
mgnify:CR=1 FL=1